MSIATLKEDLLRELAVAALGNEARHWHPLGARTRLPDPLAHHFVEYVRGPGLIVTHVREGSRLWLAAGTFPQTGIVSIVLGNVVYWLEDKTVGVSRLCVRRDPSRPAARFETDLLPLFPAPNHVAVFCEHVLNGRVRDAHDPC